MTKITLTRTHPNPPIIRQSRVKRDWMDATYNKHAYQCLPLTVANVNGWELLLEQDVVVQWDGGNTVPRVLEGAMYKNRQITQPSIIGIMSFTVGWAFNTEDNYSTWISGSPNYFIDGAVPLTASIPSYWWPDEFNMNWKITKVGEPVIFPAGMPFMFFTIYENSLLEKVEFEIKNIWEDNELMQKRMSYGNAKMKKLQEKPWTWMKGIKSGLNEKGERIGPPFSGMPELKEPKLDR